MRRREVIGLIAGAAILPLRATAQTRTRFPRVGFVLIASLTTGQNTVVAFREALRELGYQEGQNIAVEVRSAEGRFERVPALITELVRLNVDVLVTASSPVALVAKEATRTVPIVMLASDPVGLGLVDSLARPGGNITGLSYFATDISTKRVEIIKELVPGLTRLAVLKNPLVAIHSMLLQETQVAAERFAVTLLPIEVRRVEDFEEAFAAARAERAEALLAFDDPLTVSYPRQIAAMAASNRLPAMYGFREFPNSGGLISYGPNFATLFRRAASLVDKILKGASPADLPVEQPTKLELVINLKAARALGLEIPPTLLARADEVIE
jgi:putative ABC transport system substrate-binding protein